MLRQIKKKTYEKLNFLYQLESKGCQFNFFLWSKKGQIYMYTVGPKGLVKPYLCLKKDVICCVSNLSGFASWAWCMTGILGLLARTLHPRLNTNKPLRFSQIC